LKAPQGASAGIDGMTGGQPHCGMSMAAKRISEEAGRGGGHIDR